MPTTDLSFPLSPFGFQFGHTLLDAVVVLRKIRVGIE
jgi:hypothetical protein